MDITAYFKASPPPTTSPKPANPPTLLNNRKRPPNPPPPSRDHSSQPPPSAAPRAIPPEVTIEPLTQPHLHSFRRLTALLLPIRYPDKFYTDTLADPTVSSLTRIATWRDLHRPRGKRKRTDEGGTDESPDGAIDTAEMSAQGTVVGGIRCRLEDVPAMSEGERAEKRVYVQTLCLLSPYRGMGIGTALLDAVVRVGVRRYGVSSVYAHVWEANTEALDWYRKKGFEVGELEVGYYRRLKPAGARVVRRSLGVRDYLDAGVCANQGDGHSGGGDVEASAQDAETGG